MTDDLWKCHMLAFGLGFLLDLLAGDPYWLPHPVRLIGKAVSYLERFLRKEGQSGKEQMRRGTYMVIFLLMGTFLTAGFLSVVSYCLHPVCGVIVETIMTYQILATKCLKTESMKVYESLKKGDIAAARKAVSMIVGRDTAKLSETETARAAIETVAENTSDGVLAPMLYTALGGPVLGLLYKTVNTMDSMVGYQNERYLFFGRTAAKLDDIWNYLPSRISAFLMIADCLFLGKEYDAKNALRIYKRDRNRHASPNSAQTESVCAGALSIRLAGDASYFGKLVHKPCLGDEIRVVEYEDIRRANRLLYASAFTCELLCLLLMGLFLKGVLCS